MKLHGQLKQPHKVSKHMVIYMLANNYCWPRSALFIAVRDCWNAVICMVVEYSIGDSYTLCRRTEQVFSLFHNYTDIIANFCFQDKTCKFMCFTLVFYTLNPLFALFLIRYLGHCSYYFWCSTLCPRYIWLSSFLYHKYFSLPNTCLNIPDTKPDLATLNCFKYKDSQGVLQRIFITDEIAAKWKRFGLALEFTTSDLNNIESKYGTDVEKCINELLTLWLGRSSCQQPITWKTLLEALRDVRIEQLANELTEIITKEAWLAFLFWVDICICHIDVIYPLT